jgi:hexosaminidase
MIRRRFLSRSPTLFGLAVLLGAVLATGCAQRAAPRPAATPDAEPLKTTALALIPQPAHVDRHIGVFVVNAHTRIVVPAGDEEASQVAGQLAQWIKLSRGLDLAIGNAGADTDSNVIAFARDNTVVGDEGYDLNVSAQHVRIVARGGHGMFYGAVTLWQLLTSSPASLHIPAVHIVDVPRFPWRGLMLDSARHYQSVDEIKQLIDQMALRKLNTLQWHLTDDQGWRLEIKHYPKLTRVGGCREAVGPDAVLTGDPKRPYCGFYTQDQAREIVKYAADRYITVVPEIEMPGHAQAAIAAYPQIGVTGKHPPVSTDWGVNTWLYNVDDRSFIFLENVLDEVMAIFPSTYIHVGGDEAAKDQWKASKSVQAKMKTLGIANEEQLQGWFIARIGTYLDAHGRRLIGWDEILEGGLPPQATVMSWRGTKGAIEAVKQGHDVVLSPSPTLYMDYPQTDAPDEQPGRTLVTSMKDVYDFDPMPAGFDAEQAKHVLGAQVTVFSEYLPTWERTEHAVFPRLAALAERTWSTTTNWDDFVARLPAQPARFNAFGVKGADSFFAVRIDAKASAGNQVTVGLSNQAQVGAIRYTTDGTEPGARSTLYSQPFAASLPVAVRANAFGEDGLAWAMPRELKLDALAMNRRSSDQLTTCSDKLALRIEAPTPIDGPRPVYKVDIMDTCWQWKDASLDGMTRIEIGVDRLPFNYQLWKDAVGIVGRPKATKAGELEVRLDSCEGERLAVLPLAPAKDGRATLTAELPARAGKHELCLFFTGKPGPKMWVIGDVQLR